jgi:hypothetical protein
MTRRGGARGVSADQGIHGGDRAGVRVRAALRVLAVMLVAALVLASPGLAGVANRGLTGATSNPLTGMPWGVYTGPFYNSIYPDYQQSRGRDRQLLGRIALRPLAFWFGTCSQTATPSTSRGTSSPARPAVIRRCSARWWCSGWIHGRGRRARAAGAPQNSGVIGGGSTASRRVSGARGSR